VAVPTAGMTALIVTDTIARPVAMRGAAAATGSHATDDHPAHLRAAHTSRDRGSTVRRTRARCRSGSIPDGSER
jgi:hypothetical protein